MTTDRGPRVGDAVRLFNAETGVWDTGRISHFDDSGGWVFIRMPDGLTAETWTGELSFVNEGPPVTWEEPADSESDPAVDRRNQPARDAAAAEGRS